MEKTERPPSRNCYVPQMFGKMKGFLTPTQDRHSVSNAAEVGDSTMSTNCRRYERSSPLWKRFVAKGTTQIASAPSLSALSSVQTANLCPRDLQPLGKFKTLIDFLPDIEEFSRISDSGGPTKLEMGAAILGGKDRSGFYMSCPRG